uniref:Uncharacterized protein n=1 Tax=Opuntia streptacantha TaxID=393608 RepID=A0A7C9CTY8_OPUST
MLPLFFLHGLFTRLRYVTSYDFLRLMIGCEGLPFVFYLRRPMWMECNMTSVEDCVDQIVLEGIIGRPGKRVIRLGLSSGHVNFVRVRFGLSSVWVDQIWFQFGLSSVWVNFG